MQITELEVQLAAAQAAWANITYRLAHTHVPHAEIQAALTKLYEAERAVSLAKEEETALRCEWKVPWDTGAPLPHVVASGHDIYLLYLANKLDPAWDGTTTTIAQPTATETVALVRFTHCYAMQFGGPNDEVMTGHPLWGKGLEPYGAHIVAHSRWLAAMEAINSVHRGYNPATWQKLTHYLLLFHDEIFECLAEDYAIEVFQDSIAHVTEMALARLFRA